MKMIIDIDENLVCEGFVRNFTEEEKDILISAVRNSTPAIKKCPFCGSEGNLIQAAIDTNYAGIIQHTYKVKCSKCDAETRTCASRIFQDEKGIVHLEANGAIDAIDLWNRREEE